MMEYRADVYFSFAYAVIVLCFILPPKEFAAAGLTLQNLFSSYLGSEHVDFVGYHMKRTTITTVVHLFIPLVYYIGLGFITADLNLFSPTRWSALGTVFALVCVSCAIIGILVSIYWNISLSKYHPLARDLVKYGRPWRGVAAQINLEFRRLEKFSSILGGTSIYVTDSWIIKCATYRIYVAQQTDSHLSILKSEDFHYSHDTNQAAQYLHINVNSIAPHDRSFNLYLNAVEYSDLKDRLSAPLRNARSIVIHHTMSDRFLQAFKQQVEENGRVEMPRIGNSESENCIGCMVNPANIKLLKRCETLSEGECKQCYCRPMWCLECMGRWFASRQMQKDPSTWMSSLAPCPTCRSTFCMNDVVKIS